MLLTIAEAARLAGVGQRTIQRWRAEGRMAAGPKGEVILAEVLEVRERRGKGGRLAQLPRTG